MDIKDFLTPANVAIDVSVQDKAGLIQTLAARAAAAVGLPADLIAHELARRDELGSTGIGSGVCIPHARFRDVSKPFGLLVRLAKPIAFDAIDGNPVDIAFLLLLPAAFQLEQLNALAAAARKLHEPGVLQRLRDAATTDDLYRVIAG